MSAQCETTAKRAAGAPMSLFERWLTLWVALCIVAGSGLGQVFTAPFQFLGRLELAQVNLPVGVLIWVMIIPMLMKIDFGALHQVRAHWRGMGVTLLVNWAVKPFSMALLGWIFIRGVFAPWLPAEQIDSYSALAYWLNRRVGEAHNIACPSALIGASNFFELAVAAAISLFGFESGAALATVVGVLIEVPVMLLVVRVVNATKGWYEAGGARV
jgi:ACR3 family arsenite efflux pump ArsB